MMIIGGDPLSTFLRGEAAIAFEWGEHDCLLLLADWIADRKGVDPAADWRGAYRSAVGAQRIVKKAGGAASLINGATAPCGVACTETPDYGDIAVVLGPEGETGAIVLGRSTVSRMEAGLLYRRVEDVPILAAWRV